MAEILKILIVEDLASDAELLMDHLVRNGIKSKNKLVKTEIEFLTSLKEFKPDIILSDYHLPEFNGMQALVITHDIAPMIPFILVTGSSDEEIAVECMKAGADDYVIKGNLSRLIPAINVAIKKKEVIKEKMKIEKELVESEKIFSSFLEYCPVYFFFKDSEARPIRLSKNYSQMLGRPAKEAIGKSMYDLFPSELAKRMIEDDLEIIRNNVPIKAVEEFGGRIYETLKFPIRIHDEPACIAGFTVDITERIKANDELVEAKDRFRAVFDNILIGLYRTSPEGKILHVNPTLVRILGYDSVEELMNINLEETGFEPAYQRNEFKNLIEKDGKVEGLESAWIRKDGTTVFIRESAVAIKDSSGKVLFFEGNIEEITERKKAEEQIRRERILLRTLIDNLPDMIYVKDSKCRKIISNRADFLNIGYETEADVLNKTDLELFSGETGERGYNDDIAVIVGGKKILNVEEDFIGKNNRRRWLLTTKLPLYDEYSRIIGLVGIGRDITHSKEAAIELIKAKEKAEESDRLKTAFLHNISHEIRTPMNAIVGFSALLNEPSMEDEDKRKFLDIICQSSSQLLSIINDIVNIATIEAGQEKIRLKSIRVNSVLSSLNEQFRLKAQEQSLELQCLQSLPDDLAIIESDETKLIQIMSNLLNNAFKFTEKGGIYFGYEQKNGSLEFFVRDTGIGIPENSKEKIFHRFFQIDSKLSRRAGGTGLGLSLSKAYAELLGSEIHLESFPGKGSKFYFNIDYGNLKKEIGPDIIPGKDMLLLNGKPNSILVAEDEDNNFMLLKFVLANYNIKVTRAFDGIEAVEKIKSGTHFDLIIMDIKMPGMDGIEATAIIRQINPAIPVIALTAYAQETDKQKIMSSGFIDYISKPFEKNHFLSVIGKYIQISKRPK